MQELVKVKGVLLLRLAFFLHKHFTFKGVHFFDCLDTLNFDSRLLFFRSCFEQVVEVLAHFFVSQLGLQVALTIKGCSLHETLVVGILSAQDNAVSGDLLPVRNLDNVTNSDVGESGSFNLKFVSLLGICVSCVAGLCINDTMDRDCVDLSVFFPTLELGNGFLENTQTDNEDEGDDDCHGLRSLD